MPTLKGSQTEKKIFLPLSRENHKLATGTRILQAKLEKKVLSKYPLFFRKRLIRKRNTLNDFSTSLKVARSRLNGIFRRVLSARQRITCVPPLPVSILNGQTCTPDMPGLHGMRVLNPPLKSGRLSASRKNSTRRDISIFWPMWKRGSFLKRNSL